jgi:SAM-dependent methyltransferase
MSDKTTPDTVPDAPESLVDKVRQRYARIARDPGRGCCGAPAEHSPAALSGKLGYGEEEMAAVPDGANLGLGCGAPLAHLDLRAGEVVLDLGSGGGFDAFLASPRVGPEGRVIGVDMTDEMIDRARDNAKRGGLTNVEFRRGRLESLPVDDGSVDAVTSNCVINLVPDKGRVFREVARVLRPGGRLVVSDIVLDGPLPDAVTRDLLAYVGCVAGAMQRPAYFGAVAEAGLGEVDVLDDVDFLAKVDTALPDEVVEMLRRTGVRIEQIAGRVRSVTFRARKPARP